MKLAVVGATGLVGTEILEVLQEHQFPYTELLLVASARSKGKEITYNGKKMMTLGLAEHLHLDMNPNPSRSGDNYRIADS